MEIQFKTIPEGTIATHALVKYKGEHFAEVPMQFALPCKEYIVIMAAIDKVFEGFNPEMKELVLGASTTGLMSALRGELSEEVSDQFVAESGIINDFTVELSIKLD